MPARSSDGFSLIELVIAMGLFVAVAAAALGLLKPGHGVFSVQSEVADMQQRARAAFEALSRDLAETGGGPMRGRGGPLSFALPAVLPLRLGPRGGDRPGTVRPDTMTVLAVPQGAAQATVDQPTPARSGTVAIRLEPGCPLGDPACGFREDMDVLLHDGTGAFETFVVTGVTASTLTLAHTTDDWPKVYPAGSALVQVDSRTYFLRGGQPARPPQLLRYGGGFHPDVPVVDHVVGLSFEYFGEPDPPTMVRPLSDPNGPWTTYGPPPPLDPAAAPPGPASSCLFLANGTPLASPRLPFLGSPGGPLVPLTPAQLGDGPMCPDAGAPTRFDADVLRIRSVGVRLRVQAALAALRGPAGALFAQGGTARSGDRFAPDIELHFRVTPRNLVLGR